MRSFKFFFGYKMSIPRSINVAVRYAAGCLAILTLISLVLVAADLFSGNGPEAKYTLIIGFVLGPVLVLAGAPWSFVFLKIKVDPLFSIVLIFLSVILNAVIAGAIFGIYKRLFKS